MKRKKNITKKDMLSMIEQVTKMSLINKQALDVLGDFLYNYLEMKGEAKEYEKYMEDKINGILRESSKGDGEILRKSVQEEKE